MVKVEIISPWWRRPEIVAVHLKNMAKFRKESPEWVKIGYNCVISPEDPARSDLLEMAFNNDLTVLSYKNLPVSCKINAGINWILENKRPDYVMNMGSDDLCSAEIWDIYRPLIDQNSKIFGIDSCFIVDAETKEAWYLDLYNDTWPVGVLRMIRADMIRDLWDVGKLNLYPYGIDRGLDSASMQRLMRWGITPDVIHTDWRPLTCGVKCDTTINHVTQLSTLQAAKKVDFETIKHLLK